MLAVMGVTVLVTAYRTTTKSAEARQLADTASGCESTIEGWSFPSEVPSYLQWQPILAALGNSDEPMSRLFDVSVTTKEQIKATAQSGTRRATQLKAMSGNDAAIAAAILSSRDELIRQLAPATFDELQALVSTRTERTAFKLPTLGNRVTSSADSRCRVAADLAKQPHLVPEYVVWDMYFAALAGDASGHRLSDGSFPDAYISGRRATLRIQPTSLVVLLNAALDSATQVEGLRSTGATRSEIEAVVMNQRARLIRTVPRNDWSQIKAAVARVGVRYSFPATWY